VQRYQFYAANPARLTGTVRPATHKLKRVLMATQMQR
jgi:hypothetical protein